MLRVDPKISKEETLCPCCQAPLEVLCFWEKVFYAGSPVEETHKLWEGGILCTNCQTFIGKPGEHFKLIPIPLEIKPCPECGERTIGLLFGGKDSTFQRLCDECGMEGPERATDEEAVIEWNKLTEEKL